MHFTRLTGESKGQRKLFLGDHFGLLAGVARECDVARQTVTKVFYGDARSRRVEEALLRACAKAIGVSIDEESAA